MQHRIQRCAEAGIATYDADASMYRRGNYSSGEDFVLEYGELALHVQRTRLPRALRAGRAQARVHRRHGRGGRGRGPDQPRRQRRGHRSGLGAGRARQRLLAGARRPLRALARPLAAPADLPQRLARPARQGGRARRPLRRGHGSAFVYVQPDRGGEPIELAPEPSWNRVAYVRR